MNDDLKVANFLQKKLDAKKAKNPRFSLRAAARYIGMSPSMLSKILSGQRKISIEHASKVAAWLKLSSSEMEYFFQILIYETVSLKNFKEDLKSRLLSHSFTNAKADQTMSSDVESLLVSTKVKQAYTYFNTEQHCFRNFYSLIDKEEHKISDNFYDQFISLPRSVTGVGYFLKNQDGTFRSYTNRFDSVDQPVSLNDIINSRLKITFDDEYPSIFSAFVHILNTNKYRIVDIVFTENHLRIQGHEFSRLNPEIECEVDEIYERV